MNEVLRTGKPVAEDFKEAQLPNLCGNIEISRKGADSSLIYLEEQTVFAAKMLEDGTLGNAKSNGNVADARRMIAVFGEMLRCRLNNSATFRLGARTRFDLALIKRRCDSVAGDSRHDRDLKSR